MKKGILSALLLFCLAAGSAYAQTAPDPAPEAATPPGQSEVTTFPPSFFEAYNPITAWDMISRIPGFSVDGGSDVRGLSGAAGNVLINGERPPGKTDLDDILDRLRAKDIARIDLIRGGAPGIDMQGKQMVINIIRLPPTGGYSGAVEIGTRYLPGVDRGDGSLELTGVWELASGIKFDGELSYDRAKGRSANPGESRVRVSPAGALISSVSSESDEDEQDVSAALTTELDLFGGEARLTGTFGASQDSEQERETFNVGSPRLTDETGDESGGEIEASYAHSFLDGGRVQGVWSQNWNEQSSNSVSRSGRPPTGDVSVENGGEIGVTATYPLSGGARLQSVFAKSWEEESSTSSSVRSSGTLSNEIDNEEVGETALRTTAFFEPRKSLSIEAGAEAAYNFLEGSSEISLDGATILVPGSLAKVEEKRGEAFAVAIWRARSRLTVEGALRYEFSTLTTSGARKQLSFAKPMLKATWEIGPGREIFARVERTVGQLDFGDFLSSASISEFDEIITAGAVDLTPTQDWVSALQFDQQFWDTGTLRLELEHHALSDVIDNRPIVTSDGVFEATGNIGDGRRAYFNADLNAPLDRWGIAGGRLILEGRILIFSELTDPFIGEKRRFGGDRDYSFEIEFEQEIRAWNATWGFNFETNARGISYRRNSIDVSEDGADFSAFVSYQPNRKSTLRLEIDNILSRRSENRRRVFFGQRDSTAINFIETRLNESTPSVRLTYRRTSDRAGGT